MTVVTLKPDGSTGKDTYIYSSQPTTNFGNSVQIITNTVIPGALLAKGLVQFDLSSIPNNVLINSATLRMVCEGINNATGVSIETRRSLVTWDEDDVSWERKSIAGGTPWTGGNGGASGTEYASSPTSAVTVFAQGTYDWNVTSDVQEFIVGSLANNGWWLVPTGGTPDGSKVFASSNNTGNPTRRPELIINYEEHSLVLQPSETNSKDTFIISGGAEENNNLGTHTALHAGVVSGTIRRSLIQFDLSSIPPGARIDSSLLRLRCTSETDATNRNVQINRSLVEWFEGTKANTPPDPGENASTWIHRNANGSVAWGSSGGQSGVDYVATPTATVSITNPNTFFDWNVTSDVQGFVSGGFTNYGWWLIETSGVNGSNKIFRSSNGADPTIWPRLVVLFNFDVESNISGQGTLSGELKAEASLIAEVDGEASVEGRLLAIAKIDALLEGESDLFAEIHSNQDLIGEAAGSSSISGTLVARGYIGSSLGGSASLFSHISGKIAFSPTAIEGDSALSAHIVGRYKLATSIEGETNLFAHLVGTFYSAALIEGTASIHALGYAKAIHVTHPRIRNPAPLLEITDGAESFDLLDPRAIMLCKWRPTIAQYKDGGQWSDSPQAHGRRLKRRRFANAIEVMELDGSGKDQDELIAYVRDLLRWLEAAADYGTSNWATRPVYARARSAYEQNTRYAVIHAASIPELGEVYGQSFFTARGRPTFDKLTLRLERGPWLDMQPGTGSCVAISSIRSWTVAGWQSGGA